MKSQWHLVCRSISIDTSYIQGNCLIIDVQSWFIDLENLENVHVKVNAIIISKLCIISKRRDMSMC